MKAKSGKQPCAQACGRAFQPEYRWNVYCSETCKAAAAAERDLARQAAMRGAAGIIYRDKQLKLKPSHRQILAALRAAGVAGLSNVSLAQPEVGGTSFGARLLELTKLGFEWRTEQVVNVRAVKRHRYWLIGEPEIVLLDTPLDPPSPDPTREELEHEAQAQLFDLVDEPAHPVSAVTGLEEAA